MKFTSALITLSVSAVLFSGVVRAAITGTDSVQMTFKTTVTTGTCKAIVVNGDGKMSAPLAMVRHINRILTRKRCH